MMGVMALCLEEVLLGAPNEHLYSSGTYPCKDAASDDETELSWWVGVGMSKA
jgi:hypothetical protein